MRTIGWIIKGTAILIAVFIGLALRPIVQPVPQDCIVVSGEVAVVYEGGGPFDIQVRLKDDKNYYYINRGGEHGVDAEELAKKLVGKKASLYFVNHWTPLDPQGRVRHLAAVQLGKELLYSEFNKPTTQK